MRSQKSDPTDAKARHIDDMRRLVIKTAAQMSPPVQVIEEVKWGLPSLRALQKAGTPIRLGHVKSGDPALFVHCATSLIADWAEACGLRDVPVRVEGTRALIIDPADMDAAVPFIEQAFTYKRSG